MPEKSLTNTNESINKLTDLLDDQCDGYTNEEVVSALLTVLVRVLATAIPEEIMLSTPKNKLYDFLAKLLDKMHKTCVTCMCTHYKSQDKN